MKNTLFILLVFLLFANCFAQQKADTNDIRGMIEEPCILEYKSDQQRIIEQCRWFYLTEMNAMKEFVIKNLQYPAATKNLNIVDTCFVQFLVLETGEIAKVEVRQGIPNCANCDSEALRVVKSMSEWNKERYKRSEPRNTYVSFMSYKTVVPVYFSKKSTKLNY